MMEEYQKTDSVDGKEICIVSLGRSSNPDLIKDYLQFVLSEKVASQDVHTGAASLAANAKARTLMWDFLKANWSLVEQRLGSNKVLLQRFVKLSLAKFADHDVEQDIERFFEDKDKGGIDRSLLIVSDSIRTNANYKARDEKLVLEWLKAHGYAA